VGAVARAMRVTGFRDLVLVAPHEMAVPSHPQAARLAVGSTDILDQARVFDRLGDAVGGHVTVAVSARRGVSGVLSPRELGLRLVHEFADARIALVFGNERTGLLRAEVESCSLVCRIPMVGNEPSLNLSQAVMIILYEVMLVGIGQLCD